MSSQSHFSASRRRARSRARGNVLYLDSGTGDRDPLKRGEVSDVESLELWTHPYRAWDPGMLLRAKTLADEGDMSLVSDLCESLMADDRVSAALDQRVQGLEGLPLSFKGGSEQVQEAVELDFWRMSSPGLRRKIAKWGLLAGICPVYVREWQTLGGREVPILRFWHPRWLRWRHDAQAWQVQTRQGLVWLHEQPGRWYLFAPQSEPDARPWVDGLWYSTATWWLSKSYAIADLSNFGQSHATPKAILSGESGSARKDSDDKDKAISHLYRLSTRSAMYVPPGFKLDMWESNSYAWQAYKTNIDFANRALASRILGQHLTTDEAGGAGAVMDDELRLDLIEADADAESSFWHDEVLRDWYGINFAGFDEGDDDEDPVPWPVRDTVPPEDKVQLADTAGKVAKAVLDLTTAAEKQPALLDGVDLSAFILKYLPAADERRDDPGRGDVPDAFEDKAGKAQPGSGKALPGSGKILPFAARMAEGEVTDFPQEGDDKNVSLRNSNFEVFDPEYADRLKKDWPGIWGAGGNDNPETEHSGDDQWRRLRPQVGRAPKTQTEEDAVRRREAWAARHAGNKRLAGVVALVKWLVVGELGESGMKRVIEEEKDRLRERERVEASAPSAQGLSFAAGRKDPRRHLHDGMAWSDDLIDQLKEQTPEVMGDVVGEVMRVMASATSYADARRKLIDALPGLPRETLRTLLTEGMLLAGAAGMLTVGREGKE